MTSNMCQVTAMLLQSGAGWRVGERKATPAILQLAWRIYTCLAQQHVAYDSVSH